jgi:hypothetical protein
VSFSIRFVLIRRFRTITQLESLLRFSTFLGYTQERVVEACIAAGLVGGEGFAVDASLIVADANEQRSIPGTEWKKTCLAETASRASIWRLLMMPHSVRRAM